MLLVADIKRFMDRPAEPAHIMPAPESPPGAPIGDMGNDWLAPPPWYGRTTAFDWQDWREPPME
jgi:hypothetical protein